MTAFKPHRFLAGAMIAATLNCGPVLAQAVGVTAVVRNNVQITTAAKPALHRAAVRETMSLGNEVVTGASSMTQLLLLDKTSFTVGSSARVRIDRFVYDPSAKASSVTASVAKGAFRFMSSPALHRGKDKSGVRTPVASIGIRGTIFEGVVGADAIRIAKAEAGVPKPFDADEETATLVVLRGPGRNAQGVQRGAIDVTVGDSVIPIDDAGMALFIPGPGKAPIGPFRLSNKGIAVLRDLLGPRPLPGGKADWRPDPTTDRMLDCPGGGQSAGGGCTRFVD
jgi:hypothetical protein